MAISLKDQLSLVDSEDQETNRKGTNNTVTVAGLSLITAAAVTREETIHTIHLESTITAHHITITSRTHLAGLTEESHLITTTITTTITTSITIVGVMVAGPQQPLQ